MESASPVKEPPNTGKSEAMDATEDIRRFDPPPAISPINTPEKIATSISEEEIQIKFLFCAANKSTAINQSELKNLRLLGLLPDDEKFDDSPYHFLFSNSLNLRDKAVETINRIKNDLNKLSKKTTLVAFIVKSESDSIKYFPDQPHHCQTCQNHH